MISVKIVKSAPPIFASSSPKILNFVNYRVFARSSRKIVDFVNFLTEFNPGHK